MNECCSLEELQVNACPSVVRLLIALVSVPLMPLPEVRSRPIVPMNKPTLSAAFGTGLKRTWVINLEFRLPQAGRAGSG
jgi:hypothetical protein